MTKTFCDRCRKQAEVQEVNQGYAGMRLRLENKSFPVLPFAVELCAGCCSQLVDFMAGGAIRDPVKEKTKDAGKEDHDVSGG